jgi:hypothetical protein
MHEYDSCEEFPELGNVPKEKEKEEWVTPPNRKWRKMNVHIPLPKKKIEISSMPVRSALKTKLCVSVSLGIECKYGDKCHFAHSQDEIVIPECSFGYNCRFVRCSSSNEKWYNNGDDKKCKYCHPGEIRENYLKRLGIYREEKIDVDKVEEKLDVKLDVEKVEEEKLDVEKVEEEKLDVEKVEEEKVEEEKIDVEKVEKNTSFVPLQARKVPNKKEMVLKVPQSIALQAMELAIKSGTSVRIEII